MASPPHVLAVITCSAAQGLIMKKYKEQKIVIPVFRAIKHRKFPDSSVNKYIVVASPAAFAALVAASADIATGLGQSFSVELYNLTMRSLPAEGYTRNLSIPLPKAKDWLMDGKSTNINCPPASFKVQLEQRLKPLVSIGMLPPASYTVEITDSTMAANIIWKDNVTIEQVARVRIILDGGSWSHGKANAEIICIWQRGPDFVHRPRWGPRSRYNTAYASSSPEKWPRSIPAPTVDPYAGLTTPEVPEPEPEYGEGDEEETEESPAVEEGKTPEEGKTEASPEAKTPPPDEKAEAKAPAPLPTLFVPPEYQVRVCSACHQPMPAAPSATLTSMPRMPFHHPYHQWGNPFALGPAGVVLPPGASK